MLPKIEQPLHTLLIDRIARLEKDIEQADYRIYSLCVKTPNKEQNYDFTEALANYMEFRRILSLKLHNVRTVLRELHV